MDALQIANTPLCKTAEVAKLRKVPNDPALDRQQAEQQYTPQALKQRVKHDREYCTVCTTTHHVGMAELSLQTGCRSRIAVPLYQVLNNADKNCFCRRAAVVQHSCLTCSHTTDLSL